MKREKLLELRKKANLTQKDVADHAKINRSYYGLIENGDRNPSFEIAKLIAEALKNPIEDVFEKEVFFANKCYVMKHESSKIQNPVRR
jgi:putative transcriptional regulator